MTRQLLSALLPTPFAFGGGAKDTWVVIKFPHPGGRAIKGSSAGHAQWLEVLELAGQQQQASVLGQRRNGDFGKTRAMENWVSMKVSMYLIQK